MPRTTVLRGLATLVGLAGTLSCFSDADLIAPSARNNIFDRYVALGNSITAGFQAGGITEATQRGSFAALLAQSMGTRFAIPLFQAPGCPPPLTNFATQSRPAGTTGTTCLLRTPSSSRDIINNVAVPGATSLDPNATSTSGSTPLTTFILGGKTQVQRAIMADPTFISVWIGNNDVLGPAVSVSATTGTTAAINAITDSATFAARFNGIIDSIRVHSPDVKGLFIGVVEVTNAPLLVAGSALLTNATLRAEFDAIACGANPPAGSAFPGCFGVGTTVLPSCNGSTSLVHLALAFAIVQGQHPAIVSCSPGGGVGDLFVLDAREQTTLGNRVRAFNNHILSRATALDFAYWDPNNTTDGLPAIRSDAAGSMVKITPNPTSATNPFGTGMSFDGVHPNNVLHLYVANRLIPVINAKYGTNLPAAF